MNHKTGELYIFSYDVAKPLLHFTLFSKNKTKLNTIDVKISSTRMIHDFPITENYVIFPDLPLELNANKVVKEGAKEGAGIF